MTSDSFLIYSVTNFSFLHLDTRFENLELEIIAKISCDWKFSLVMCEWKEELIRLTSISLLIIQTPKTTSHGTETRFNYWGCWYANF